MEIAIIKFLIIYIDIATLVLLNLLFNKNIQIYIVNNITQEKYEPPAFVYLTISLLWIFRIRLILYLFKKGEN